MFNDLLDGISLWPAPAGWLWLLIAAVVIPLAALVLLAGVVIGLVWGLGTAVLQRAERRA